MVTPPVHRHPPMIHSEGHGRAANLLVLSDLHLGEVLDEAGALRRSRELSELLEFYAEECVGGRPWRLVLAGDVLDFVHARVDDRPDRADLVGKERALVDLDHIVSSRRVPFAALAAFVARGHELVILRGNHDAELHWPEVQERLVEHLVRLGADRSRIQFSPWFWHEPSFAYIEHGNQYDRFCSFEHVLEPTLSGSGDLEDPIAHQTFRSFARSLFGTCDVHVVDTWTLLDFGRWLRGLGARRVARIFVTYLRTVTFLLDTRRRLRAEKHAAEARHRARLQVEAARFGLEPSVLDALDSYRERPAGLELRNGLSLLYMDRFVVIGMALFAALAVKLVPTQSSARLVAWNLVAVTAAAVVTVLARARVVVPVAKLRTVAGRIEKLVGVENVVFGHSHVPGEEPLAGGGRYFNTGSFAGDASGGRTHLCLPREGRAELRQWCPASRRPVALPREKRGKGGPVLAGSSEVVRLA